MYVSWFYSRNPQGDCLAVGAGHHDSSLFAWPWLSVSISFCGLWHWRLPTRYSYTLYLRNVVIDVS